MHQIRKPYNWLAWTFGITLEFGTEARHLGLMMECLNSGDGLRLWL